MKNRLDRRQFNSCLAASTTAAILGGQESNIVSAKEKSLAPQGWEPNYMLASSMYGYEPIENILPEVSKTGASAIDIWPKVHGNQREQLSEMGEQKFAALLKQHQIALGCITQFGLGPFGLQQEMRLAKRLGCQTIVTGSRGPANLEGQELKKAIRVFIEQMKPHLAIAQQTDVTIAIENHSNSLISSPDSLKWLCELCPNDNLGVALAPYHLEQDSQLIADLIESLGSRVSLFYAWQHGKGCMKKLPKADELLQMPGRGALDFEPIISSLKKMDFNGWVEIFMHPVPRGIPILESPEKVTAEINQARTYLTQLIQK